MVYYFLKEDFDALNKEIDKLVNNLRKISLEGGKSAQEDRGIFSFEEYERQKNILSTRVRDFIQLKNKACVVEPQKSDVVSLGSIITVRDENNGKIYHMKIGSYMVFTKGGKETISYNAPLAKILIGCRVDDVRSGRIGDKKVDFRILRIE